MGALLIGDVAERAGVPASTIRYYESIGLLRPAPRASSGYRRFSEHTIEEFRNQLASELAKWDQQQAGVT